MSGYRMEIANEAVKLFLKSLPDQSQFGIYCFGTSGRWELGGIQNYNNETRNKALEAVGSFKADMGGT